MASPTADVTCELTTLKLGFSKRRALVKMKAGKPTDIFLFRKGASEADELKALGELQESIDTRSKFRPSSSLQHMHVGQGEGWE
jgi:hypothetical protein